VVLFEVGVGGEALEAAFAGVFLVFYVMVI
jgi:hypothetical protein